MNNNDFFLKLTDDENDFLVADFNCEGEYLLRNERVLFVGINDNTVALSKDDMEKLYNHLGKMIEYKEEIDREYLEQIVSMFLI